MCATKQRKSGKTRNVKREERNTVKFTIKLYDVHTEKFPKKRVFILMEQKQYTISVVFFDGFVHHEPSVHLWVGKMATAAKKISQNCVERNNFTVFCSAEREV